MKILGGNQFFGRFGDFPENVFVEFGDIRGVAIDAISEATNR